MIDPQLKQLSYSRESLADATGFSVDTIQKAYKRGELTYSYFGTKPVILRDEALRWLRSLPNESSRGAA